MQTIKLLDGTLADVSYLVEQAKDDNFYYNYLGKVMFSSSIIGTLLDSPKKYYYTQKYGSSEESTALSLGRIIHVKALEPKVFEEQFEVVQVKSKNSTTWRSAVAENAAKEKPKSLLTLTEDSKSDRVAEALLKNEAFISRLNNSYAEVPAIGEIMGFPFRAKADILRGDQLFDLKTTADLKAFPYSAKKYNYDSQAFIYCTLFGIHPADFEFVAVDKASLDIGVYNISESFFESGRAKVERALETYSNFFLGKDDEEKQHAISNYFIQGLLE